MAQAESYFTGRTGASSLLSRTEQGSRWWIPVVAAMVVVDVRR